MTKMIETKTRPDFRTLGDMLEWRRPHGSKTERRFIARFLEPLGLKRDGASKFANLYIRIGTDPVLWSSHTDTVHDEGGRQRLAITEDKRLRLAPLSTSNCLGADCTAGVWLMREMILAGKPGLYVFHRGEEKGGIGSRWIAENNPGFLRGIEYAVAFDRRGSKDIITHQMYGRCCSDEFAKSLAGQLNMAYAPCPNGSFTDTANYTDLIGECSNISVGYQNEHSKTEELDCQHLAELREAILAVDVNALIAKRAPGEVDPDDWHFRYDSYRGPYNGSYGGFTSHTSSRFSAAWKDDDQLPRDATAHTETARWSNWSMEKLVRQYPEAVADYLEGMGIDPQEIEEHVYDMYGTLS